jgi:hypothetical protein
VLALAALIVVPGLVVAQGGGAAGASRAPALPSAGDVLARYRAAIGGEDAIRAHTARRTIGQFELPAQNIGGAFEMLATAPNRMLVRITLGGLGTLVRGYDGSVGWAVDPAIGPRVLEGAELAEVRHSADFYYELHDPSSFSSLTVTERAPFEGKDCYTLHAVRTSGFEVTEYYDAATGLLAGFRMNSSSSMGTVPGVVTVLDAYKNFGGLLEPSVARQRAMGMESVLTVENISYDPIPDTAFALPPEIKALVK